MCFLRWIKNKFFARKGWYIGPTINGKNRSLGMPKRPTLQGKGWYFDFPTVPYKHVHYVQNFGVNLTGAKALRLRYKVEGNAKFFPQETPDRDALVSIQIQSKNDNWSAQGKYRTYRVFSKDVVKLQEGTFELYVPLVYNRWIPIQGAPLTHKQFQMTVDNAENISVLFGGNGGRGHGVYADSPAKFTMLELEVVR